MNRWMYRIMEAFLSGRLPDPRSRKGFWTYATIGFAIGWLIGGPAF